MHREFIEAGAQVILTNSFGGTRNRLKLHPGLEEDGYELNRRAAELARAAVNESGKEVVVAGSMGPTGDLYEPIGPLSVKEGAKAFAEQAQALKEGGVDLLWLETLSSLEEIEAAIKGASSTGLEFVITVSFDSNGKTMMGLSPTEFANWIRKLDTQPLAFGANCGAGTADLAACMLAIQNQGQADTLLAKSNAGIPEYKDGDFVYTGTPEHMAQYALLMRDMGIKIIGGCCGTTPAHLSRMREALESIPQADRPTLEKIEAVLGKSSQTTLVGGRSRRSKGRRQRSRV